MGGLFLFLTAIHFTRDKKFRRKVRNMRTLCYKQIMEALPYKVIKSLKQYNEYCGILEDLVTVKKKSEPIRIRSIF